MKWSTSLLALVLVAANVIATSSALECHACQTVLRGACGDDNFNGEKVGKCSGDICVKNTNKNNGKYILHCVPKKEDTKLMVVTLSFLNRFSKFFH